MFYFIFHPIVCSRSDKKAWRRVQKNHSESCSVSGSIFHREGVAKVTSKWNKSSPFPPLEVGARLTLPYARLKFPLDAHKVTLILPGDARGVCVYFVCLLKRSCCELSLGRRGPSFISSLGATLCVFALQLQPEEQHAFLICLVCVTVTRSRRAFLAN